MHLPCSEISFPSCSNICEARTGVRVPLHVRERRAWSPVGGPRQLSFARAPCSRCQENVGSEHECKEGHREPIEGGLSMWMAIAVSGSSLRCIITHAWRV